tara:strand:+ start:231 stop:707 length:477 start_codon:yes stop_codon:yes gene_type:complete
MTTKTVQFYQCGWTCSNCDHECNSESDYECNKCQKPYEDSQDSYWEDEGDVEFPAQWVICYDCNGNGTTYLGWASKDQPAFTREDFDYEGPDFYQDYMSGQYDAQCPGCRGSGKIKEIDEGAIKPNTPLSFKLKQYLDDLDCQGQMNAVYAAERRMGA